MNWKMLKKLKWINNHFQKRGFNDARTILIGIDMDPDGDTDRSPLIAHHNMCCHSHYLMTLLELLRSEVSKMKVENPEAAAELEEMIRASRSDRPTIH